ncbi:uncharacterized protein [Primulina eburnea]|uniref:uncharacterized protein n=1 Tax=Primulina eburnea TaxID=1245227 RepID=UPI003C6C2CB5
MSSRFQAAVLVSAPCYPNAVACSEENLVAVASGSLVTILHLSLNIEIAQVQKYPGIQSVLAEFLVDQEFWAVKDRFSLWVLVVNACVAGYTAMFVCSTGGRVKLYRFPFCDFSAEWIEVAAKKLDNVKENNTWEIIPIFVSEGTPLKIKECNVQLITAQQYASRNAMLTPLLVAWSPILRTSEDWVSIPHNSSGCCSILATGLKCGLISFRRIDAPESYSIITPELPCKASNGGFLKAHDTCITSICWALYGFEISKPQLLLATGSSNGRRGILQELLKSSETVHASFSLLREVPYVYDSCFGLAVSHGSLAIAVKAAIEFLWIGGQQLDTSSNICFDIDFGSFPGFPEWASEHLGYCGSPCVFQTVDTKLCRAYSAEMVDILFWIKFWHLYYVLVFKILPTLSTRKLHLINVIIRHVVLKNDEVSESRKHQDLERFSSAIDEQTNVWKELQLCCENELRRRLVGLYFSAILELLSDSKTSFKPSRNLSHHVVPYEGYFYKDYSLNIYSPHLQYNEIPL